MLNAYNAYMASPKTKDWCFRNGLNSRALKRASEIRAQMAKLLEKKFNIPISSCHGNSVLHNKLIILFGLVQNKNKIKCQI